MLYSGFFSLFLFLLYILREVLAFGAVSIPVKTGIKAFEFFPWHSTFWATIPGTFILMALIFLIVVFVDKQLDIIRKIKIEKAKA